MRLTSFLYSLTGKYADLFLKYGAYSPTPLSLKKLIAFGREGSIKNSSIFLSCELPVRLANIMQEIQLLPEALIQTQSAYEQTFCELIEFAGGPWDEEKCKIFNETLAKARSRHENTVETMAEGVMEMKEHFKTDTLINNQVQYFLDRFYMMRISLRMLINQHLLMFGSELNEHRRYVGSIDPDCNVFEILQDAYADSKYLCEHNYLVAPEMKVKLSGSEDDKIVLVYVPSHLYYILFELLKNAMRAVIETHKDSVSLPPVEVLIAAGKENVTIKISDLGGGISRSEMDVVFHYTYTTARNSSPSLFSSDRPNVNSVSSNAQLAGYGYGLPISRLYAKYFNGDLILASVEGFGTDVLVYLKRQAAEADELLPIFNRTSAKQYGSVGIPIADWSNPHFKTGWRKA